MTESTKPILPIDEISEIEFNNSIKTKHLDNDVLKNADLKAIEKLFGLTDRGPNSPVGSLNCDEAHAHSYKCHYYRHPAAGVVDRLIREIRGYSSKLEEIGNIVREK
jgi:hypothetical protein